MLRRRSAHRHQVQPEPETGAILADATQLRARTTFLLRGADDPDPAGSAGIVGDQRLKRPADQVLMRVATGTAERVVGRRNAEVRGIVGRLFQDEDDIVRVIQRVVKHPLERRRVELTMLHPFGP